MTGIEAGLTCVPSITILKADRPFYFQIVDETLGVLLFAGAVRRPDAAAKEDAVREYAEYEDEYAIEQEGTRAPRTTQVTMPQGGLSTMRTTAPTTVQSTAPTPRPTTTTRVANGPDGIPRGRPKKGN